MYPTLGARRVFEAAMEDFYRRVVGDEELRRYFDGIELGRLKALRHDIVRVPGTEHDREAGVAAWPRPPADVPLVQSAPLPNWERRQPARRAGPVERGGAGRAVPSAPVPAFEPHPDNPAHERPERGGRHEGL